MAVAKNMGAPTWVTNGADEGGGIDLLGLRLPVQAIGGRLFDGMSTVTPSVRYIALRAWLIQRFGYSGQPDSMTAFSAFAGRIESAFVFGNLLQDRGIVGLIGGDEAKARLDADTPLLTVSALVATPASITYAGPSDQLGVSQPRGAGAPGLVIERGLPLANVLDQLLARNTLLASMLSQPDLAEVSKDALLELGELVRIDRIPDDERTLLIDAIIPRTPRASERQRIGTYAALLALAAQRKTKPSERDFFDAACSQARFGEFALDEIADGWIVYCVRDAIAVTQEAVLGAVMSELAASPHAGKAGIPRAVIIDALMERGDEHSSALWDLGLLDPGESITQLSFRDMVSRIETRLGPNSESALAIARWPNTTCTETRLYARCASAGAGALSLSLVAWVLASIRTGGAVRNEGSTIDSLSFHGARRLGMREVILPALVRFHDEDRPWREVAAELACRTVQQHLQVAWSRMQGDITSDVALLTSEGGAWYSRGKAFVGGRTASRLDRAVGWLTQLKLIDGQGITADGKQVLQRAISTLSGGSFF